MKMVLYSILKSINDRRQTFVLNVFKTIVIELFNYNLWKNPFFLVLDSNLEPTLQGLQK